MRSAIMSQKVTENEHVSACNVFVRRQYLDVSVELAANQQTPFATRQRLHEPKIQQNVLIVEYWDSTKNIGERGTMHVSTREESTGGGGGGIICYLNECHMKKKKREGMLLLEQDILGPHGMLLADSVQLFSVRKKPQEYEGPQAKEARRTVGGPEKSIRSSSRKVNLPVNILSVKVEFRHLSF